MVKRACECEADRLRRHVDGRLGEGEQDKLIAHLEDCERCREALDALAGDDRLWNDLRVYLADEPGLSAPRPAATGRADGDAPGRPVRDDWDGRGAVLAFLDPPTDPGHMGSLGPYQVVEAIGRGGMGLVLKGLDPALGRVVAIKVLAPELSYLGSARLRFAREARAAASVAHDHVVAIHAVDSWKGLPYLVMQYVAGKSLQGRIERDGPLAVREVLRIGMQVASGLAAAHAQGLVHRDVKPANILLENGIERVKITDFGLARAADDASLSQSGVAAGTPHYMAPEQARCEPIDPRADLFGLGSVMYAMCTGHPPFRADTAMAVLRRVCDDSPRPIRGDHPEVPAWLEGVIAKLLAKDPAARFQTAAEVADLLGRCLVYLEQPTGAPPFPGEADRLPSRGGGRRWGAAALAVLVLVAGLGAAEVGGLTGVSEFLATVFRIKTEDGTLVVTVEDPAIKVHVDGEELAIEAPGLHEFRYRPGRHRVVATRDGTPVLDEEITISRGGKRAVTVRRERTDVAAAKRPDPPLILLQDGGTAENRSPAPDVRGRPPGESGGTDPNVVPPGSKDLSDVLREMSPAGSPPLVLSPRPGAVGNGAPTKPPAVGAVLEMLRPVPARTSDQVPAWPFGVVSTAAYSPDGTELAVGNGDGSVTLCSTRPCRLRRVLGRHPGRVWSLAYSPDGKTLAAAGGDWERGTRKGFVTLWDVATGRELARPAEACDLELAVAFSPDGGTLAWGGRDRTVTLWDVAGGRVRATCVGHEGTVRAVAFHPRERKLVSAGFDGTLRFWDTLTGGQDGGPIRLSGKSSNCVAVSPDGKTLASNTGPRSDDPGWGNPSPGTLQVWDWSTRTERFALKGHRYHILGVAFSPDGKTLASAGGHFSDGAEVKLWDVASGRERRSLAGHTWWVECVAFSPDSRFLVSAGGYEKGAADVLTFSPDSGAAVRTRGHDKGTGEVRVWDLSAPEESGGD